MKKTIKVLFCLLLLPFLAHSQSYKPEWGPVYKKEGGLFAPYRLVGMDTDYYYLLMQPRKGGTLLKFDFNHKLVSNQKLNFKYKKKNIQLEKFIETKNGRFGYLSAHDPKTNEWNVFSSQFTAGKFSPIKRAYTHPFRMKKLFLFAGYSKLSNDTGNKLVVSDNKSLVGFTNVVDNLKKGGEESIKVALFDANMELMWEKTQKFKYQDKSISILQTVIGNDGVIYVLGMIWEKQKNKKAKGLPNYDYKVFRITEQDMTEYPIDLGPTLAPTDAGMFFPKSDKNEFVLAGFYTDANRKSGTQGVFYASGNKQEGIKNIKTTKFESKFLENLARKKDIEKDRGIGYGFDIDNFFELRDGSIGFIAEEDYVISHTYRDGNGNSSTSYTYYTNDIIIPRFGADGNLTNIEKVEKNFSSQNYGYTSYSVAIHDNQVFLLFNDHKNRADRKKMKGKRRWTYTDLVVLDEKGNIATNKTLFNSNEIDLNFIPSMSDYYGDKFLVGSASMKKYSFGIMDLTHQSNKSSDISNQSKKE